MGDLAIEFFRLSNMGLMPGELCNACYSHKPSLIDFLLRAFQLSLLTRLKLHRCYFRHIFRQLIPCPQLSCRYNITYLVFLWPLIGYIFHQFLMMIYYYAKANTMYMSK
ncbi:putative dehydrogenase [Trichinella spiralis]|uniref:putative dehydrogenase n=1 Tax=Trichinella spiralis TaxID=6334 RepID=UPI0001EFF008|nr:putative dehydrogenase [Trichinella spiralis]